MRVDITLEINKLNTPTSVLPATKDEVIIILQSPAMTIADIKVRNMFGYYDKDKCQWYTSKNEPIGTAFKVTAWAHTHKLRK